MNNNFNYSLTCADLTAERQMGQTWRSNYSQSHQYFASQTSRSRGDVL